MSGRAPRRTRSRAGRASTITPPAQSSGTALRATPFGLAPLWIVGAILFFEVLDDAAFLVASPDIAAALDLDVLEIVEIVAFVATGAIVAAILLAWWADRTRRLPFLTVGTTLSGMFAIGTAGAGGFGSLAGVRVLNRVAEEAGAVPRFALLAEWYPPATRGRVFTSLAATVQAAQVVALIGVALLVRAAGFRLAFVVTGVPLVVLGLLAHMRLDEPIPGALEGRPVRSDPPGLEESFRAVFRVGTLRRLIAGSTVAAIGTRAFSLYLPFFLADVYDLDALGRGLVLAPLMAGGVVGAVVGGRLLDRLAERSPDRVVGLLASFSVIVAAALAVFAAAPSVVLLAAVTSVFGFGAALTGPARLAVLANLIPPSGRTTGLQLTFLHEIPALLLAPTLGGIVQVRWGYDALFLAAVPFLIVAAFIDLSAAPGYAADLRAARAAAHLRETDGLEPSGLVARGLGPGTATVEAAAGTVTEVDRRTGRALAALLARDDGSERALVHCRGRDLLAVPAHRRPAAGVAVVPADGGAPAELTPGNALALVEPDPQRRRALVTRIAGPDVEDDAEDDGPPDAWMLGLARALALGASTVVAEVPRPGGNGARAMLDRLADDGITVVTFPADLADPSDLAGPSAPTSASTGGASISGPAPSPRTTRVSIDGRPVAVPTGGLAAVLVPPGGAARTVTPATATVLPDLPAAGTLTPRELVRLARVAPGNPPPTAGEPDDLLHGLSSLDADRTLSAMTPAGRRLAALAVAVAAGADLVVAPDPTADATTTERQRLVADLWRLHRQSDATLVLVAHGPTPAARLASVTFDLRTREVARA